MTDKNKALSVSVTLPVPIQGTRDGLQKYISDIRKFPILTADEELALALQWRDFHNKDSAHKLVTSHLRLVVAAAHKYKGYGLPILDLIAEGNIGLMQAVKKFDPDKGFRLATYAMWWIRAAIQDYILRSWSLVKIGTTMAQKKLFFGLGKAKRQIEAFDSGELHPEDVKQISENLDVPEFEVVNMNRRLIGGDASLDTPINEDESSTSWGEMLPSNEASQEIALSTKQEEDFRHLLLEKALEEMPQREREILTARRLTDPPIILDELSEKFEISRERVRQIENRAYERLKENMQKLLITYNQPKLLA